MAVRWMVWLAVLVVPVLAAPASADRLEWDGAGKSGSGGIEFLDPQAYPDDALMRARAAELERQRQAELERQRQAELERRAELERQRQAELERRRRAELERVRPGRVFRDCAACPELVVIPPGEFLMGSPEDEEGRERVEGPQHRVRIGYSLAVGRFEVTFAEWDACVSGDGCNGYRPDDGGWGPGRRPVIDVSWEDALAYADWLSRKTGEDYRLLSESEWEYAARAGTETPFHFGGTIRTDQANYNGNYTYGPGGRKGVYRQQTVPVGSFAANGFGLHDVHGNVWEWVADCWHGDYSGAPSDGSAWTSGCSDADRRLLRGGSWYVGPWFLRSAIRGWSSFDRDLNVGFRVARTL